MEDRKSSCFIDIPSVGELILSCLQLALAAEEENEEIQKDRLQKLGVFQLAMIKVRRLPLCAVRYPLLTS